MFQHLWALVNSDPTFWPFRNKQTLFGPMKLWAYSRSLGRGATARAVTTSKARGGRSSIRAFSMVTGRAIRSVIVFGGAQ